MLRLLPALLLCLPLAAAAGGAPDHRAIARRAVETVIVPGAEAFAEAAGALAEAAPSACEAIDAETLRARFHDAWDAWMRIQHFRFGPLEEKDRALAITFWPDVRGATGRAVERMFATEDPAVDDPAAFADISVAARGFHALERLLYDESGAIPLTDPYRCRYAAAIARDLDRLAGEVVQRWRDPWGGLLTSAGEPGNTAFLAPSEVTQRLFLALVESLEQTAAARLDVPLGGEQGPRPRLAEAWRSGRSLRQVRLAVEEVERGVKLAFGLGLPGDFEAVRAALAEAEQGPPLAEAVAGPGRARIEALRDAIVNLIAAFRGRLGPALGISRGFNAADGD